MRKIAVLWGVVWTLGACSGIKTTALEETPGPTQNATPTPAPQLKLHVAGFGDSVTDGYCSSSGKDYVSLLVTNDDAAYPGWAGKDLSSHFASVSLTNASISGSTSCDYSPEALRSYIQNYLATNTFDADKTVVVITLGGNDLIEPYGCSASADCAAFCSSLSEATPWASAYKARMTSFIQVFYQEIPGDVEVFLANIYDPTDGIGDIENAVISSGGSSYSLPAWPDGLQVHGMYNDMVADIATTTGAHLVDMHAAMLGHGIHFDDPTNPYYDSTDPSYWYCANLEDPNDAGYHAIRGAFYSELASVLGLD